MQREEEASQPPSEDVMDDLMSAPGSCTATQYITQLQGPVGWHWASLRPV